MAVPEMGLYETWVTMSSEDRETNASNRQPAVKVTYAEAIRDIVMRAIDRGQLVSFTICLTVLVFAFRLPEATLSQLANEVLARFLDLSLAGWGFTFLLAIGWFKHASWQRRTGARELKRVAEERNRAQKKQMPSPTHIASSSVPEPKMRRPRRSKKKN